MGKLERERAQIRALIEARKSREESYLDYPEGIERDAYNLWQFLVARTAMPGPSS